MENWKLSDPETDMWKIGNKEETDENSLLYEALWAVRRQPSGQTKKKCVGFSQNNPKLIGS